jgi:single-strand DNA-binding protein
MAGNNITIVGNITRDPELRFTPSGQANARLGVAVNRRWQDRGSGEWQEATSFFDVICWRELAENVAESLKRGARVVVTGRLEQRTYEREGGEKRSVVEIIADEVAPSLRWATAKVEKTERRAAGDAGGGGGGYGRSAAPVGEPPPYDDFGDEPF